MESKKANSFTKIGKLVTKRKYPVILAWVLILVLVVPFIFDLSGVISLQMNTASDKNLESQKAGDVISQQFASTVPSNTLIIVLNSNNASSLQTQNFVSRVISSIKSSSSISRLENVTSIYSVLVPVLNQTNQATYAVLDNANLTINLLYGVPAAYLNIWTQVYNQTQSIEMSNPIAYNQTAAYLQQSDPASFSLYASPVLDLFYSSWVKSFQDPQTLNYTIIQRATGASTEANNIYVNTYLGSNKDFGKALINTYSLVDFLSNSADQTNQKLTNFAVEYISSSSGLSTVLVNASNALGRTFDTDSLATLTGNIIANPDYYRVGEQLTSAIDSLVSSSKEVTLISIGLNESKDVDLLTIRDIIKTELAKDSGDVKSALVTGSSALDYDFGRSATQDFELILPVTIGLLLVATGLFFKSIVTPIITLGAIGVGLGISQIFVIIVGTYINQVDFMIPTVLLTVLIGVGTDYSIFIIARHREEMINGLSVKESIIQSVTWAGESIATSGTTVIISFLGLAATTIVLLQTLGLIVGASVIVALLISLTLVPALAAVLGDKLFWPNSKKRFQKFAEAARNKSQKRAGYFARSGIFSVKHAKILILVAILVTVPLFYVYATTTPSYNFLEGASNNLESISASKTISSSFGGGSIFPTYIVVTYSQPLVDANGVLNTAALSSVQAMSESLLTYDGVGEVVSPTMPYGSPVAYSNLSAADGVTSYYSAVLQSIGTDNKTALITVKFEIDPYSNQALSTAQNMRTNLHDNYDNTDGVAALYVGGTTGGMLDVKNIFDNQFNTILPIVTIGVAIVLFIVLGSLVLPIFAVLSVLMSIVWTLAVTTLVFQSAYNYGLLFITPIVLLVLLLGIGMDYNIFILTRIREESAKGQKLNQAIIRAIEQTGGIITAAAIILAGSLGALMLSSNLLLKELGFAFAFSILIDALVVRTYLVPAVMSALGKWNWYNPLPFFKRSKKLYEQKD